MKTKITISIRDQIYINDVLVLLAECTSSGMSKLSFGILVGYALVLGSILANLEAASKFLGSDTLSKIAFLFLIMVIISLTQRFISSVIASGVEVANRIKQQPPPENFNIQGFMEEVEQATFWPMRIMMKSTNRKVLAGNFTAAGQMYARYAQLVGLLVFLQIIISIIAISILTCGLKI